MQKKIKSIHMRVTDEERDMILRKAEARGMTISEYILYLVKKSK